MKRFTLFLALIAFSTFTFAQGSVKVTNVIKPTNGSTINSGVQFDVELEVTNDGTVDVAANDTIIILIGIVSGGQITNVQPIGYFTGQTVAQGATYNYTTKMSLNITGSGTITLGWGALWAKYGSNITFRTSQHQVSAAIESVNLNINKVYYSNEYVNLELNNNAGSDFQLMITNLKGQVIETRDMNIATNGTVYEKIYTGYLKPGFYVLSIVATDGSVESTKFIVQ